MALTVSAFYINVFLHNILLWLGKGYSSLVASWPLLVGADDGAYSYDNIFLSLA